MTAAEAHPHAPAHAPVEPADRAAVEEALRWAWGIYLLLGGLPAIASIVGIWVSLLAEDSDPELSLYFMLISSAWLTIMVPAALLYRRLAFNSYYKGGLVEPANFLKGSVPLWLVLVGGGLISQLGWILSATPITSSLIAVCALVVYLVFYPTGHAMTRPVGAHDDPAIYEEPS